MTRNDRPDLEPARAGLAPADARLVERMRSAFVPEREDGVRQRAFDAALRERIEAASQARGRWSVALGSVALVLAAAWLGLRAAAPPPLDERAVAVAETRLPALAEPVRRAEAVAWEESLFFAGGLGPQDAAGELPVEYRAIAAVFLDGTL